MARNGYPEDFDLIDVPGYPGMRMQREAALQLAGACAEFWMETGEKPGILEAFRTIGTHKHYAATMKPGTFAPVINGIGTSNHGLGLASDMASPLNSYSHPLWAVWDRIARKWGFNNGQGRATGKNGEPWHYVRAGTPQIRASGREMADMANLVDTLNATRQELGWLREQQNDHVQKQLWMAEQADRVEGTIGNLLEELTATRQELTWLREQADRGERKLDEVADKDGVKSRELRAPAAKPIAPTS